MDETIIPIIEEELVASAKPVTTGGIRVEKHVDKRTETVDLPLTREQVDVRRVPINRVVDKIPTAHQDGDEWVVPVLEEELVITKRTVLKEEIRITKKRFQEHAVQDVELRRESADIHRIDPAGGAVPPKP